MRIGMVSFSGALGDDGVSGALRRAGHEPVALDPGSHDLQRVDGVIVSEGAARAGDLLSSALLADIVIGADRGMPLLGLGRGFEVLCAAHLLPGAVVRGEASGPAQPERTLLVETTRTSWTAACAVGQEVAVPSSGASGYLLDLETLDDLQREARVVARFGDDGEPPALSIAGVTNAHGNVVGLSSTLVRDERGGSAEDEAPVFFAGVAAMLSRTVLV